MSESHEKFVSEYLKDYNATRAYMAVYPDSNTDAARVSASRLLTNANIKKAIAEKAKDLIEKSDANTIELINRQREIAFSDIRDAVEIVEGKPVIKDIEKIPNNIIHSMKIDKSGVVEIKAYDAQKALDALMRYYSLYNDKVEVTNNINLVYLDDDDKNL